MGGVDVFKALLKNESIFIRIRFLKGKVRVNSEVLQRKQREENWCSRIEKVKKYKNTVLDDIFAQHKPPD